MRMVECGNSARFPLEAVAEPRIRDFDRDSAAQSRVHRAKHFAHAAFAEFGFDAVRPQARSRSEPGDRLVAQFRCAGHCGPLQKATFCLRQKLLYFAAHFWLCLGEQSLALRASVLAYGMV